MAGSGGSKSTTKAAAPPKNTAQPPKPKARGKLGPKAAAKNARWANALQTGRTSLRGAPTPPKASKPAASDKTTSRPSAAGRIDRARAKYGAPAYAAAAMVERRVKLASETPKQRRRRLRDRGDSGGP